MAGEPTSQHHAAGQLLAATAAQLRARRDDLEPLVAEYDRVLRIRDAFGEVPSDDSASSLPEYAALVGRLRVVSGELDSWAGRLEPLVREYEQILHVLQAVEAAEALPAHPGAARRRPRAGRGGARSGAGSARTEELRGLLTEPRARAEIAELMGLSRARVTELLEPLARTGEVVDIRDPERPTRKLWALAQDAAPD
ncbi:MAG TPA: hypothetical protein VN213_13345, partial [Solirubrobacteraceae bacterium]|nr:hypothetical protein [Solirubrobacteraceae bacterium]